MPARLRANILLTVTAIIWGAAFVAQRAAMEHLGPMTYNGVRFALGGLALLPLALRSPAVPGQLALRGHQRHMAGLAAGVLLFVSASLQQVGMLYTTAGNAGFITGLYVVLVPILGLWLGQRSGPGVWLGVGLSAVGLYLLSITENFSIGLGDFLELLCAVCFAGHVLLVSYLAPRMPAALLSCLQYATCAALSLLAALLFEPMPLPGYLEGIRGAAIPILYGGLMSVGLAYTLQVVAQKDAEPSHAAIILSLEGAFAALTGWWLLGEVMSLRAMTGCALMLAGTLVAQLWPQRAAQP